MPDVDFFNFFRWTLGTVVTIYASIITWQSLYGWYVWLAGGDKHIGLLRRYLIIHGLRLRFARFWGDVLITLLLCVAFLMLWRAHHLLYDLADRRTAAVEAQQRAEAKPAADNFHGKQSDQPR